MSTQEAAFLWLCAFLGALVVGFEPSALLPMIIVFVLGSATVLVMTCVEAMTIGSHISNTQNEGVDDGS